MLSFFRSSSALASPNSNNFTSNVALAQQHQRQQHLPIPEEILEHILNIVFPSSSAVLSTSPAVLTLPHNVLLVSRTFNRIATPLLYRALYLSSTKRANALAATLKQRPDLAICVKAIRVESPLVGVAFEEIVQVLESYRPSKLVPSNRKRHVLNYLDISLDAPRIMPTPRARTMSRAGAPPSLPDATVPSDNDVRHFCRALARVPDVRKVVVRRSGYATARSTVEATCALTEGVRQWMSLEYAHLRFKPGPLPVPQAVPIAQPITPKSSSSSTSSKTSKPSTPLNLRSTPSASTSASTSGSGSGSSTSSPISLAQALSSAPHLRVLRTHTPTVWSDFFADIASNVALERIELVDAGEDMALDRAREATGQYTGVTTPVTPTFFGGRGRGMSEGQHSMPAVGSLGLGGPVPEYGIEGVGATHTLFGAQVAKHPRLQALVAAGRKSVLATKFSLESHQGGVSGSGMVVASVPSKADSVITAGPSSTSMTTSARLPTITLTSSRQACSTACPDFDQEYVHPQAFRTRAYTNPGPSAGSSLQAHSIYAGRGQSGAVRVGRS